MVGISHIEQKGSREILIKWSDDTQSVLDVVDIRRKCPCAACVDEWTRKPILKPEGISEMVRPKTIESVGQYALKFTFSDNHSTGIYTYNYLREISNSNLKN